MCTIFAVANQKGGVGKTSTAVNLGTALALKGYKVLLIDFDPQANLSSYLGFEGDDKPTISNLMLSIAQNSKVTAEDFQSSVRVSEENKISYIPSDINLANAETYLMNALSRETVLKRILKDKFLTDIDYVIIDCLPSLGTLLINALTASDKVLIPVQAQKFAYDGLKSLMSICGQIKETINKDLEVMGILPTMVDGTNMSRNTVEMLNSEYGNMVFNTMIHRSVSAANSTEKQRSLCLNKSKLGEEYKALADELVRRCG